jgi:NodT family efflux transporter outer membrane factor (OMF) lipoprotein
MILSLALAGLVFVADPAPQLGPRYANATSNATRSSNSAWWTRFSDPSLNALVTQATTNNFSVLAAQSRIDEADAVIIQQLAPLMPTATWDTSLTTGPLNSLGFQFGGGGGGMGMPGAPEPPNLYWQASSSVNLGLELDITGKNVLGHKAAKLDHKAAKHDVDLQRQTLASEITAAYYDLVAARAQLAITQRQVETNETLLELTEVKFEAAQANAVDVLQQRQQLAGAKLQIPRAQQQAKAFEQRLAVLIGEVPGRSISTPSTLPALPVRPDVGAPSDLLQSRPDLRASRERLDATEQRTKVARRSFAPTLRLTGQAGVQSINVGSWSSQGFWSAGATLSVPLSTGGSTYGKARQAKAQQRTASRELSQSTLTAVQEVEDALVREAQQVEVLALYKEQHAAAQAAFEESRKRYAEGIAEYLPVLTALASVQSAELNIVTAERDLLAARIDLYTALGDR